jgi:hypothetical protein
VLARRFGFSREKRSAIPIYVVQLQHGQKVNAVYEEELKPRPRI